MKILLAAINAKYIHSNLAVYDLKAYVKELPVEVVIEEYTINQQPEVILQKLYEQKADIIGFSCYIWNIEMIRIVAKELHKIAPNVRIWFGGPEASYNATGLLEELNYVELVMIGEGEHTFYELMDQHLLKQQPLETISGIAYRSADGIEEKPVSTYLNMDAIPFVYEELSAFENKIIYYETSRGCPFRCSYCLSSIDKRVRLRSLELVEKELAHFLQARVHQVKFVDRTFNCNHEHAYRIWKYILEHDNGVTNFHFEISADLLKEEDFLLFEQMRPGLIQLEIGVQSTNPETITAIRRTMDLEILKKNVARVHAMHNIHQHLDLIAGLPYETVEIFEQSFNDVYAMQPDQLQLGFLKVLKGSYMQTCVEKYEILSTEQSPYEVLATKWISYEDVLRLKGVEEMTEVYYNSGQFVSTLNYVIPFFKDAFSFFDMFAQYYKKQGLFEIKHTRLARYDILRDFMIDRMSGQSEEAFDLQRLEEYLLYDLYVTEHSKKRPLWAADDSKSKEQLKQLRGQRFREERLSLEQQNEVEQILKNRTDLHLELFEKTKGGYVLFDYSKRHPLTNQARECLLVL